MSFTSEQQRARWEHYAATYEWMFGVSDRRGGAMNKRTSYPAGPIGTPGYAGYSAPRRGYERDSVCDKVFDIPGAARRNLLPSSYDLTQGSYLLVKEQYRCQVFERVGKFWDDRSYALVRLHEFDLRVLLSSHVEYTRSYGWTVTSDFSQEAIAVVLRVLALRDPVSRAQLLEMSCSYEDTRVANVYRLVGVAPDDTSTSVQRTRSVADEDGFCYLRLVKEKYWSCATHKLGKNPTLSSVMALPFTWVDVEAYATYMFVDTTIGLHVEPGGSITNNCAVDFVASAFQECDLETLKHFEKVFSFRGRVLSIGSLVGTKRVIDPNISLRTASTDLKPAVEVVDSSIWSPILFITTAPDGAADECVGWAEFVYEDIGSKYSFPGCNVDVLLCMTEDHTIDHRGMQFSTWDGAYYVHLPARTRLRITIDDEINTHTYVRAIPLVSDVLERWQEYYPVVHPMRFSYVACIENVDAMVGSVIENLTMIRDGDSNLYAVTLCDEVNRARRDNDLFTFTSSITLSVTSEVSVDWLEGFNLDVQVFTGAVGFAANSLGINGYLEMVLSNIPGTTSSKLFECNFQPC